MYAGNFGGLPAPRTTWGQISSSSRSRNMKSVWRQSATVVPAGAAHESNGKFDQAPRRPLRHRENRTRGPGADDQFVDIHVEDQAGLTQIAQTGRLQRARLAMVGIPRCLYRADRSCMKFGCSVPGGAVVLQQHRPARRIIT